MKHALFSFLGGAALLLSSTPLLADESGVERASASSAASAPSASPTPSASAVPIADTYSLSWVREAGAEECVSDQQLGRLIEQIVGPVLRPPSASTLQIEGVVSRVPAGYRVMIRVTDARGGVIGERELVSPERRCSSLTPSILLVLAVIVDPEVMRRGLGEDVLRALAEQRDKEPPAQDEERAPLTGDPMPREPEQPTRAEPEPTPLPISEAPVGDLRHTRNDTHLLAAGALGLGIVPQSTPGFVMGVLHELAPSWALRAEATYFLPQSLALDTIHSEGGTFEFDALQLSGSLCARAFGSETLFVRGCAGGWFGERHVTAEPLSGNKTTYRSYFGPSVGGEAFYTTGSFWFARAALDVAYLLRDDRFVYRGQDSQNHEVYAPTVFPASFSLGLGARL